MSQRSPRQRVRRFAPQELAAGAVVVVALAAVVSDFASDPARDFWADHAMATAMLSGLILVLLTALVVQRAIERYESQRWDLAADAAVDSYIGTANRALVAIVRELSRGPTTMDPWMTRHDERMAVELGEPPQVDVSWWEASPEELRARLLLVARTDPGWFGRTAELISQQANGASTMAMAAYPVLAHNDRLAGFVGRIAGFQASLQDIYRLSLGTSLIINLGGDEASLGDLDLLWRALEQAKQDWADMQDRYFIMRRND